MTSHGDAEPLFGVDEVVVVVTAEIDLHPVDLAAGTFLIGTDSHYPEEAQAPW